MYLTEKTVFYGKVYFSSEVPSPKKGSGYGPAHSGSHLGYSVEGTDLRPSPVRVKLVDTECDQGLGG